MTKQCKYVFKQIKLLTGNTSREFGFIQRENVLYIRSANPTKMVLKKYPGELNTLIDTLIADGYLVNAKFGIQLTHKGLHPFSVSIEEIKRFLIKSIVIPIVVSVLASLATMWLKGLL